MTAGAGALGVAAAVTAALHIRAEARGPRWQVYLCKPLTTSIILLFAALAPAATPDGYRALVLAGLVFSLVGDVCLMLPQDRFRWGLASFLIAHLLYIAAFSRSVPFGSEPAALLPFLAIAAGLVAYLWPGLGAERGPVLIYVAVIAAMGWQAAAQWLGTGTDWAALALAGAVAFLFSDATLALDRFRGPLRHATAILLASYYAAQWLIAASVWR